MIGNFKPNLNKRVNWRSLCITNNSSEAFTNFVKHDGAFIHSFNVDDKKYFHALKQGYKTNLETELPIYNQILQQEQIELYKLIKIVEANNGTVLDVNTDSVSCVFPDDKLPFTLLDDINIKDYYWDNDNKIPKYKIEDKGRLKTSRMANNIRTEKFINDMKYKWNITSDVDDNDFMPLVNKILESNESYFITGAAGCGISTLINMIKQKIKETCEEEEEEDIIESVDMIRIKQKYEMIKKKLQATTERLKTKLSKTRKQEADERIKKYNQELEELNNQLKEQQKTEVEADKIKSYVSLAPTNLAALIINGTTIHKFSCMIKSYEILKNMKFKYIFLDEVSMLTERFYRFLLMIKKLKKDVKFNISGDFSRCHQLTPEFHQIIIILVIQLYMNYAILIRLN
jgi:hypothetical protein